MIDIVIVALIVGAAAWHAGAKYLPASWRGRRARSGCGSGCDTCNSCAQPDRPGQHRVIRLHRKS